MAPFRYRYFGTTFLSEVELPELYPFHSEQPQVTIQIGEVPLHLEKPSVKGVLFEASPGDFLLRLPSIGSYRVSEGKRITLMPEKGVHPEKVRLFLLGSVMGALFHQRNQLPMHGTTVVKGNFAVCILGYSAAGKSTLGASLAKLKEFSHLADDISVLHAGSQNRLEIFPGQRVHKLWKDVAEKLYPGHHFKRVRPELEKYYVPLSLQDELQSSFEIGSVLILTPRNEKKFHLEEIRGAKKLFELRNHVYRDPLIKGLGLAEHHFDHLSQLAAQAKTYRLYRPQRPLLIKELTDFICDELLGK